MKAKILDGIGSGGARNRLADVLPLTTPYLVHIFPIYACNFKCGYCLFSVPKGKRGYISDVISLDFELYKKMLDELSLFPNQIKVLRFVGMGEPLLHKNIVDMITLASKKKYIKKTEILSNGYYLTKEMSDKLIDAGLKRLAISIQGLTPQKYEQVCGVHVDLIPFINQIRYYYDHKSKNQILHIKIIDCALDNEADKQIFYDMFGDICDTIGIEHVGYIFPNVDYSKISQGKLTQFGLTKSKVNICPQPFFAMYVNPEGKVSPCYSMTYPMFLGNIHQKSLYGIWNGESYRQFRLAILGGVKNVCSTCADCEIIKHRVFLEDDLSSVSEKLKVVYEII
jgi:radical SAM protein with 4Fe4S-binding SPASM domain